MLVKTIAKILSGFAFDSQKFNDTGSGMQIVRIRDVGKERAETYYSGEYKDTYLLQNGDFLIGMDGNFRLAEWNGGKALLNQRVCKIIPDESKINKRFLFHYLPAQLKKIEDSTPFVTVKHLSVEKILNIDVPVLSLIDQQRIATILDHADTIHRKNRQILEKYDELAKSVFYEMFGDPEKNQFGFKTGTIRDLVSEVKYGTSNKSSDRGSYPYLRMNNLTYDGNMDFTDMKYVDIREEERVKHIVRNGDILFNRTNSKELVGKTAVYKGNTEMVIAGYLIRVRVNQKANPEYISAYLNSKHGKATLMGMCKSIIGMANINAQEMQNIKILMPPIDLQNHFSQIIERIANQKALTLKSLVKSEDLFQSLLQRAFRGEL